MSQRRAEGRSLPLEISTGREQQPALAPPLKLSSSATKGARDHERATILLIDPRPLTRECIHSWLVASSWEFRVLPFAAVTDFAQQGRGAERVHLIVLNIGAARVVDLTVLEDIGFLNGRLPEVPIVLLADLEDSDHVIQALRQGVRGYIPTSLNPRVAIQAMRLVLAGGTFVPAKALVGCYAQEGALDSSDRDRVRGLAIDSFTPRQSQVLVHLREGKSNKVIAYELDMCESTVKVHVRHIMKKLKATNRTQVAFLFNQLAAVDRNVPRTGELAR